MFEAAFGPITSTADFHSELKSKSSALTLDKKGDKNIEEQLGD
jgi:hypothetical protein